VTRQIECFTLDKMLRIMKTVKLVDHDGSFLSKLSLFTGSNQPIQIKIFLLIACSFKRDNIQLVIQMADKMLQRALLLVSNSNPSITRDLSLQNCTHDYIHKFLWLSSFCSVMLSVHPLPVYLVLEYHISVY